MKNELFPWAGAVFYCSLAITSWAQSPPPLRIDIIADSRVQLTWVESVGTVVLEESNNLSSWRRFSQSPTVANGQLSVILDVSPVQRFFRLHRTQSGELPPDPASIAPPLQQGVASLVGTATEFLYTGPNPVQTGVAAGTIVASRAAVLRGTVKQRDDSPLAGVTVSILGHAEFGQTLSRLDGKFDLVVNGGSELTLKYEKAEFCPVHRQLHIPWQDYVVGPDVVMIRMDPAVTSIALGLDSPLQSHQGTTQLDADGARRATLIFKPGTCGSLVMPDGTVQECSSINVRATEFTVGTSGPDAMPGALPPSSGYTYCVELSADEAVAVGAEEVRFTVPVPLYVENFRGFPVGSLVPTGFYDRTQGRWVASDNGRVIKLMGVTNSVADLDLDGNGVVDDEVALAALAISEEERRHLATLYPPGQEIWRSLIAHFTPWDYNWPYGPPPGSQPPGAGGHPRPGPKQDPPIPGGPNKNCGSIIGAETQSLGQVVRIAGSPFNLHYQSDRVTGRREQYMLKVRLSGAVLPPGLQRIHLEISASGKVYKKEFPAQTDLVDLFSWDGKDAYGRIMQGQIKANVRIGYEYIPQYYTTRDSFAAAFNRFGTPPIATARGSGGGGGGGGGSVIFTGVRTGSFFPPLILWQDFSASLGSLGVESFGGWSLNAHHAYDVVSRTLYLGNGDQRSSAAMAMGDVITTAAGVGGSGFAGDGGPATDAKTGCRDLAVGPDGSVYFADQDNRRVRRVGPDGIISTVAGTGFSGFAGDGGPALQATLSAPRDVALGPDGSLYITDQGNHCVRRVGPDGLITTVAGSGGMPGFSGDGGPATEARMSGPSNVAVAADGTLYIADTFNHRIRRVGTDGLIITVAGNGEASNLGSDGGLATLVPIREPRGVAVGSDGAVYLADQYAHRIRRVGPDGVISTVAGTAGAVGSTGDGEAATLARLNYPGDVTVGTDGALYIADEANHRIRRVGPDGIITTLAGSGPPGFAGEGGPARQAQLNLPQGVASGPDGSVYVADTFNFRVRRIRPALPGGQLDEILIAAEDGSEIYFFTGTGRHQRTLDPLTGTLRFEFAYDEAGRLTKVTDGDGHVTTIERDGSGAPVAITAPLGLRTTLAVQSDGYLSRITNPAGDAVQLTYHSGTAQGLLATLTDPQGGVHRYTYDALGRLVRDENPAGGAKQLTRIEIAEGHSAVVITTALGLSTRYETEALITGDIRRVRITPSGARTEMLFRPNGTRQISYPDGSVATLVDGPDPRFGMQAPISKSLTLTQPGGMTSSRSATRTATLSDPGNPFSLTSHTDTLNANGQIYTNTYDAATRKMTTTTPVGRMSVATLDAIGRLVETQTDIASGLAPVLYTYDNAGLLTRISQGVQSWDYRYDPSTKLTSWTDAAGAAVSLAYDAAGQTNQVTLPSGNSYKYTYAAQSQCCGSDIRTQITMPSNAVHRLDYSADNQESSYTPPGNSPYVTQYDADGRVAQVTLPTGRIETFSYDVGGRPTGVSYPEATVRIDYAPADTTTRVHRLTRTPVAGSPMQEISSTYDGSMLVSATWNGAAQGQFTYTYDANLSLKSMALSSGAETVATPVTRDPDGLLTGLGPFTFNRSGPAGAPSQISNGALSISLGYDALQRLTSRSHTVAGAETYALQLSYDTVGRISTRVETISGAAQSHNYTYDADSQLIEVRRNGIITERYSYDSNRNRVSQRSGENPAETAVYDAQDRLVQRGPETHQFNADGYLAQRGGDTFSYSTTGELLEASVDGQTVTYAYDGLRRRVSRTSPVGTTRYFYGNPENDLQVTHTQDQAGVLTTYYYYDNGTAIFAIRRGTTLYSIVTDPLGSPRIVTQANGTVIKTLEYDSFGTVVHDSNPGFDLPIGFGGGLADTVTHLVRFGWRDYDPMAGRWTARDPALFDSDQTNLYAYCHNNPVNLVDPLGLASVGLSVYDGIGVGAKLSWTEAGLSACMEVGFGTRGASLEIDPSADLDDQGFSLDTKIGLKAGIAKVDLGLEIGECANFKPKAEACVGPFCANTEDLKFKDKTTLKPKVKGKEWETNDFGVTAKIAARHCVQARW